MDDCDEILPAILLDEALKFVSRNYTDGKGVFATGHWKEGVAILAAFVAYGYAWYLLLYLGIFRIIAFGFSLLSGCEMIYFLICRRFFVNTKS